MFRNYLRIAFRHSIRHRWITVVKLISLAIGLTFSMLIGGYVLKQEKVNSQLAHLGNQYIILSDWKQPNLGLDITTLEPLANTMKRDYPALVANAYSFDLVVNIVTVGDQHYREGISVGDTSFISQFGFPLVHGDPSHPFRDNQSAVVTEGLARKFFGKTDVLGKTIRIQTPYDGKQHDFVITAVLKDQSYNSVENFNSDQTGYQIFLPVDANFYFQGDRGDDWSNAYMVEMLQLQKGVSPSSLGKPFREVLEKNQPPFAKGQLGVHLAPLKDYFLQGNSGAEGKMVTTLSLIATLILILGIANFVNLTVGTSSNRLKEIGMRKVLGSQRANLILQFMLESGLLTLIAGLLSLELYQWLLPFFNRLLETTLDPFWKFGPLQMGWLLVLLILVALISGIYPGLVLSSSSAVQSLLKETRWGTGNTFAGKVLLLVQFTLAAGVFICSLIVSSQVSYVFHQDVGFDRNQVLIISSLPRQWDSAGVTRMENAKSQILSIPQVKSATLSFDIPDGKGGGNVNIYSGTQSIGVRSFATDGDYGKVFGLRMKQGHFLNTGIPPLHGQVVLNEKAARDLGWGEDAVGKILHVGAPNGLPLTVTGVVGDFHFESMKLPIQPMILSGLNEPFTGAYRYMSVKINPIQLPQTMAALQNQWKILFPEAGFEYEFMDDKFRALYTSELEFQQASLIATVLNLIIVFLGIIAVVAFTLNRRVKEFAVRKVLGAKAAQIILLIFRDYFWLILVSNLIAWPVTYLMADKWLDNYAYRIHQNLTPYLTALGSIFILSIVVISFQALQNTSSNPARTLNSV